MKFDAAEIGRAAGIDVSALTQSGQDPTQAMRQLKAVSGKVETIGREEVRGVATTHYRATVDLRRFPDLVPARRPRRRARRDRPAHRDDRRRHHCPSTSGSERTTACAALAQKLSLDAAGVSSAIEQRFEFYDFGAKVDIRVPDPDEVTDVSDLAAAGHGDAGALTLSRPRLAGLGAARAGRRGRCRRGS